MSSIVEKITENGRVIYQLTITLPNGSKKVEKYERAFDVQKRQRQLEEDTKKGVTGSHYA
ncbi:MAG: hypothetical protein PHC99_06505 [Methylococcales bacterium]|nr:hypothetical protein [Methylococcales bacterium]